MNDFVGMEELLQDFLMEAGDMLSDVDSKLMELEKSPDNAPLLNEVFRGFHTIKGGAGFLNATELVTLCHLTENLFDKLRNNELKLTAELMDVIFAATAEVRKMFSALQQSQQPTAAPANVIQALKDVLGGKAISASPKASSQPAPKPAAASSPAAAAPVAAPAGAENVDWNALYNAITGGTDIVKEVGAARDEKEIAEAVIRRRIHQEGVWSPFHRRAGGDRRASRRRCANGGSERDNHTRRYRPAGPGAQPVRRDRADQEPSHPLALRYPARP
jgi:two-component system chemotaxis sensor kinase CheA